ncbi:MAG TPA: HAMP domain-containing sensor histidine kinase [Spongiibacteraceae bacterium]|nr:HAMP domain-containing sensor histidine kinase [Spongiibacteraceae bacterium]
MNIKKILASLTFRFMVAYVAGLSLAVFVVLALLFASYSYNYFSEVNKTTHNEALRLEDIYNKGGRAALAEVLAAPQSGRAAQDFLYLLVDKDRNKLSGTLHSWPANSYASWLALEYGVSFEGWAPGREQLIAATVPLRDGEMLLVARDYSDMILFERIIVSVLLRSMIVTIVMGALGGAVVAGRGLQSVDAINRAVQSIMAGDFAKRIELHNSGGDFLTLAININRMLDRIQTLMEGMRQVSDNIAHDLRTPLTRLRNHLASLQARVDGDAQHTVHALLEEADSLLATFSALLRIAQVESGNRLSGFSRLDLSVILHDVVELYEPLAMEKQIVVTTEVQAPLPLSGDRDLLFQAFANLLDNAIKYTPEHGAICIRSSGRDGGLLVEVADSGVGISQADRERVFRRFFRVESSRSMQPGNGLGLSLVQAVVNLHRGSIVLGDNSPGLKVAVRLPSTA